MTTFYIHMCHLGNYTNRSWQLENLIGLMVSRMGYSLVAKEVKKKLLHKPILMSDVAASFMKENYGESHIPSVWNKPKGKKYGK